MKAYTVSDKDAKLISFIYELLRDHILPGDMETVVRNSERHDKVKLSNNYIAKYAESIVKRLK